MFPKSNPVRSKKLRDSARGQQCQFRLPHICTHDPATTVLAHAPFGGRGMALKGDDAWGAFACSACHSVLDGHVKTHFPKWQLHEEWLRAIHATQKIWIDEGLIMVKGIK